ncbi:hypothetical protein GCM10009808_02010 [Microbacterium sediminicola]|uniref:Fe-S protein n=1 Tax=Microbacterium sediminicola TaxID=415210 RepID=A0ABP4TIA8_9MICO
MEILRHAVLLVHLTGFAILFGAWVVQVVNGQRRLTNLMNWGLLIAAVGGIILSAPFGLYPGQELDYVKIGTKLVILLVIGALLGIGMGRQRKTGATPPALFWLVGILTFANAAIATLWH